MNTEKVSGLAQSSFLPGSPVDQGSARRVLVTGDRDWECEDTIRQELALCTSMEKLGHGKARGADTIAGKIGAELIGEENILGFQADWDRYHKAAGPIRNRQMRDEFMPDFVLAFHDDLERSKGTKDMIEIARKAGIPVKICHSKGRV
jgi:hypothetical protein